MLCFRGIYREVSPERDLSSFVEGWDAVVFASRGAARWVIGTLAVVLVAVFWVVQSQHSSEKTQLYLEIADAGVSLARTELMAKGPLKLRDGELYAGDFRVDESTEIVDTVLQATGFGCTIFLEDRRIATTATAAHQTQRALGTRANPEVRDAVFDRGEVFRGVTTTIGKDWVIVYTPLVASEGQRIGMLASFRELDQFRVELWRFRLVLGGTLLLLYLLLVALVLLRERHASKLLTQGRELAKTHEQLEQKAAALALAQRDADAARQVAEQANTAKSKFLATMSHELRTPLNAILGYTDLVLDDLDVHTPTPVDTTAQVVDDVSRIKKSGTHLLALINDLLDLSKVEADAMDLHIEPFSLVELVEELVATIRPLAQAQQNRVGIELEQAVATMHSDRRKLQQVLLNLLSNACKFTKDGEIQLVARELVRPNSPAKWVEIVVSDTGIGVPAHVLPTLFEPFSQADTTTQKQYGGTGLGLAISREMSRLLGGTVTVESIVDEGTTFGVRLPLDLREKHAGAC